MTVEARCDFRWLRWLEIDQAVATASLDPHYQNYRVACWPYAIKFGVPVYGVYFYFKGEKEHATA